MLNPASPANSAPSSSSSTPSPNANEEVHAGQPAPFTRTRSGSESNGSDGTEPSAKRSRRTGSFGAPAQQTTAPTQPAGSASAPLSASSRIPGQTAAVHPSAPPMFVNSGRPSTRESQPTGAVGSQARPQTRLQVQAQALDPMNPSAAARSADNMLGALMHHLLAQPLPSMQATQASTADPSLVTWDLPPAGTMQGMEGASTTGPSVSPPANGNDHRLTHLLAQPSINAQLNRLQAQHARAVASTAAPQAAVSLPAPYVVQGVPIAQSVAVASVPAMQPLVPPRSVSGVTRADMHQTDMLDAYLGDTPMGQIDFPTAQALIRNIPRPGEDELLPLRRQPVQTPQQAVPGFAMTPGTAHVTPQPSAGQNAGPVPAAWLNPLPQPMPMPSANDVTPTSTSNPAPRNPPGV